MTTDTPEGLAAVIEALRRQAKSASETSRMLAEAKSLRQNDHGGPPRTDLYSYTTPEQTLEWRAADLLTALKPEAVAEVVERCAKIATDLYDPRKNNGAREWDEWSFASARVAAAIRASVSTKGSCDGRRSG